jgi:hypothetical protein
MKIVWFSAGYRFYRDTYDIQLEAIESVRIGLFDALKSCINDQAWYWMLGELCACLDVIEGEEPSAEPWHSCLE